MTLAMAELMLSGCTTTTDHHYVFPAGLEDAIDIEVAAAQRLGLRVLLTRGSMNLSQRDGGLPPEAWCRTRTRSSPTPSAWWRAITRRRRRDGADRAGALLAVFGHDLADARHRGAGAAARCAPAHPPCRNRGREPLLPASCYNCRPLDYLEDCGWLNDRVWLAHGIHFNADEIKRLARAGTPSPIAPAAIRRWPRAPARSARWRTPACASASASTARLRTTPRI